MTIEKLERHHEVIAPVPFELEPMSHEGIDHRGSERVRMGISYLAEVFEGPLLDGWVEASQLRIIPVDQLQDCRPAREAVSIAGWWNLPVISQN